MKKILSIFFILILIPFINGCSSGKSKTENQILNYNLPGEPKTLDPQIADDYSSNIILTNIFEGLTRIDKNENVIPGVAKSWETNNNNTEFIFHLRKDTFWSDKNKKPVTAKDFVFAFKRAIDRETQAPKVSTLFCIKNAKKINQEKMPISELGVSAIDDFTLKIELEYPNENFLKVTSTLITMPCNEEFFNASEGQYGLELKTTLGNGPFKLKNKYGWEHFKSISLLKNEGYQGEKLPISAGVNFSIGKELNSPSEALKNGLLDAAQINVNELDFSKKEEMNITSFEDTLWAITFNISNSVYSKLNIRKAIFASIDRDYTLLKIPTECSAANNLTLSQLKINGSNFLNSYGENLYIKESPEFKKFLNSGFEELKIKELPKTSIICLDEPNVRALVSNIIEKLNKNLNLNFNMTPLSKKELLSKVGNKDFQIALFPITFENENAIEFFNSFTTNSKSNIINLNDTYYDKLINQAYDSYNTAEINELLSQAEKFLNEKAIIYPLYKEKRYFATPKNVSGVTFYKYKKGIDFLEAKKSTK